MFKKGYKLTMNERLHLSQSLKGIVKSPEHRRKLSLAMKGKIPWSKGKKNFRPEYVPSTETKKKTSISMKGKNTWMKGRPVSIEKRLAQSNTMKERVKKGLHNNYKGGITPLRKQIRECSKYTIWRSEIFKRDNFSCRMCNIRAVYLEADHYPKKFSFIIKENNIKTIEDAINCMELWDTENGRTLCKPCHKLITFNKKI